MHNIKMSRASVLHIGAYELYLATCTKCSGGSKLFMNHIYSCKVAMIIEVIFSYDKSIENIIIIITMMYI